tara:strand:- start:319 stop:555 length:237 start_codon:yes stop_codon:yes gene_type:complete
MLSLIASCLLAWSVSDREHLADGVAAMATLVPKEEGNKASTWGLDELGSIEWRGMMTSLIKEKERQAPRTASSRVALG